MAILRDGILLSIAMVLNYVPQLLISIFSGHMDGLKVFDTSTLYLLIDSILGALSCSYAIGSVCIMIFII